MFSSRPCFNFWGFELLSVRFRVQIAQRNSLEINKETQYADPYSGKATTSQREREKERKCACSKERIRCIMYIYIEREGKIERELETKKKERNMKNKTN